MNTHSESPILASMQRTLERQRRAQTKGGAVTAEIRIDRLQRALELVFDNRDEIVETLSADFGHRSSHQSLMSDIYATIEALKHSQKKLRKWMKSEKRKAPVPMNFLGAKAWVEYQPKGVIGIIGTWNFPINTVFAPLAGVFAAGNRAMIKCSEVTPRTSALLEKLVKEKFSEDELVIVNGGPEVGAQFAALPFDHIIFTGATSIGRHILRAASDNLTPVTLELGGKSPCIISQDYPLDDAAERIINGKILNSGQVCLSPDYIFVHESQLDTLVEKMLGHLGSMYNDLLRNPDYSSVVNARHFQRLQGYLQEAREKGTDIREFNPAGEDFSQQDGTHKIPMTLVINPAEDLQISREELFGPVIAVRSYRSLEECIDYVNDRDRPLALYYFGRSPSEQRYVLDHSVSGAVTINDVIFHVSCEDLPFGGIGPSGMGNYHGVDGFRTFSHAKAVYKQSKVNLQKLGGMLPPYGDKCDKTLKTMIKK